jgi:hypothetical protein
MTRSTSCVSLHKHRPKLRTMQRSMHIRAYELTTYTNLGGKGLAMGIMSLKALAQRQGFIPIWIPKRDRSMVFNLAVLSSGMPLYRISQKERCSRTIKDGIAVWITHLDPKHPCCLT